jgi:hypothetical protein
VTVTHSCALAVNATARPGGLCPWMAAPIGVPRIGGLRARNHRPHLLGRGPQRVIHETRISMCRLCLGMTKQVAKGGLLTHQSVI